MIAKGSLYELQSQLFLSKDLGFISDEESVVCDKTIEEVARLLTGFIRSAQSR